MSGGIYWSSLPGRQRSEDEQDSKSDNTSINPAMTAVITVYGASYPYEVGDD